MNKAIRVLLMLVLGLLFATSSALAFSLGGYTGALKFKFNDWDYGTLYNPNTNNPRDGVASGNTDSYGIFSVTSITDLLGSNLWSQTAGEALEGWFYGLSDDGQVLTSGSGNIWTTGGILEVYLGTRNLNPTAGPGAVPAFPSAPADIWNVTDGSLFLRAAFVPGIVAGDGTTTYLQDVTSITTPISGQGTGYLSVLGGSHGYLFNSNQFLGGAADFYLETNFNTGTTIDPSFGWTVVSHDPVLGYVIPEPTSMLLLGMGMLGLVSLRKKKAA